MKILRFIFALIRGLPSLFWMTVVLPLLAAYKSRRQGNKNKTHEYWSKSVSDYLQVDYQKVGTASVTQQDVIFLCNHRTQADFFITDRVTEYRSNILSRKQVAYVFPFAWVTNPGSVWFFNRNNINVEKFNQWLDEQFAKSFRDSLIIFPEGHRMYRATQVTSLKTGMIKYSYMRKKKVQIVMTFGNEQIFNERQMKINFGSKVYYSFSEVIDPNEYPTQQEYVKYVSERFKQFFAQNHKIYMDKLEEKSRESKVE